MDDFQEAVEERMVKATARAISFAVAQGGADCRVSGDVCARTSPQCADGFQAQCGGAGFEHVVPCCKADQHCVVATEDEFVCWPKSFQPQPDWIGTIAECTLPTPPPPP